MSENDIVLNKFISQDDLDKQDMEWLKKQQFGQKLLKNKEESFLPTGMKRIGVQQILKSL